jgi:hypothetical protein
MIRHPLEFHSMACFWPGRPFTKAATIRSTCVFQICYNRSCGSAFCHSAQRASTFSLTGLLVGRIVPRTIEVDHAQIEFTRDVGGAINVGPGSGSIGMHDCGSIDITQFREQLSHPASGDHARTRGLFDQIQRAHFREVSVRLGRTFPGLTHLSD